MNGTIHQVVIMHKHPVPFIYNLLYGILPLHVIPYLH